jgi:hypothetical protein
VQPQQQQVVPRARGREYKRHADPSVVLTLVNSCGPAAAKSTTAAKDADADTDDKTADEAAAAGDKESGEQQQQPGSSQPLGGDYDGPEAVELQLSGIPDLPPDTVGPPSPIPGMHDDNAAAGGGSAAIKHEQGGSGGLGSMGSGQQQGGQRGALQLQSSASAGLELLDGGSDSVVGPGGPGGGSGGMRAGGSGEITQSEWGGSRS